MALFVVQFLQSSLPSKEVNNLTSIPSSRVGEIYLLENSGDVNNQEVKLNEDKAIESRTICVLEVPPFMIPGEILHFFGAILQNLISVQILQHYANADKYLAILNVDSAENAKKIHADYNGQSLSSLENISCQLFFVLKISCTTSQSLLKSTSSDITLKIGNDESEITADGDEYCTVCLEPLSRSRPSSFTTACNHTFHIQCIAKLEGSTCPVCRFQHDAAVANLTECFVCGYGNHVDNRGIESSSSSIQCEDLWVCLICGFTGCGDAHMGHIRNHYEQTLHTYAMDASNRQKVWDFAGDGYVHRLILNSEETALDHTSTSDSCTDSIDIVGCSSFRGSTDSLLNTDIFGRASTKIVEIVDPRLSQDDFGNDSHRDRHHGVRRSQIAPLSNEEEELLINRKLEQTAFRYNQQLAWQLHHMRSLYQSRLQLIQHSAMAAASTPSMPGIPSQENATKCDSTEMSSLSSTSSGNANWRQHMLSSLSSERGKLLKLFDASKDRLERSRKELDVLQELSNNLSANERHWKEKAKAAKKKLEIAETEQRIEVARGEAKVAELMQKLDAKNSSSSSSSSSTTTANTSSIVSKL